MSAAGIDLAILSNTASVKEIISTTGLSAGEIAYQLDFKHPQSLSRLFKAKTGLSPMGFRQSFN